MNTTSRVSEVPKATPESIHTLGSTAVLGMDPMEGTDTATGGAGRHVLGDLKDSVGFPDTRVIYAEDSQILRLDAVHIGGIRDGEATTPKVLVTL